MNKESRTAPSLTQWAVLGTTGPLGYQGILLTQIQVTVSHNMQIPLGRTALQPLFLSLYADSVFPCPKWWIQHLLLLNSLQLVIAQPSDLSLSFCKASCPRGTSQLLQVHCNPKTQLVYCWTLRLSHLRNHWRTLAETRSPLEPHQWLPAWYITPFTITLWAQPMDCLSTYHIIVLLRCILNVLSRRLLWEMASKALLKSKRIISSSWKRDQFLWPRVKRRQKHIGCGLAFTEFCQIKGIDSLWVREILKILFALCKYVCLLVF